MRIRLKISPAFINRIRHFYYIDVRVPTPEERARKSQENLTRLLDDMTQAEIMKRWIEGTLREPEEREMSAEERYYTYGETGDRALDAEDEDLPSTEEYPNESDDDEIPLSTIDWTDDPVLDEYFQ